MDTTGVHDEVGIRGDVYIVHHSSLGQGSFFIWIF